MTRVNIIGWIAKRLKALVGIVEDTDTATHVIAKGKYVIWKGSLRKTAAAIGVGDALSSSNLSEVSEGIGNELNSKIANPLNIQFSNITGTSQSTFESSLNTALNGMNTGDVRCCSAYANYSQSLTNGGQSIAFLYKQTTSVWWCFLVMSGSTKVGYYTNSVWTWL